MVVDVGKQNLTWNLGNEGFEEALSTLISPELITQIKAKSEWNVECVEVTNEKFILRFTLKRIVIGHLYGSGNDASYSFNDTDYPLNLSDEHIENANQYLGKSFICEIPCSRNREVVITKNEFMGKSISISKTPFVSSKYSMLLNVT
jgi:hypothetical protein